MTAQSIIESVAAAHGLRTSEVTYRRRQEFVRARDEAMATIRLELGYSYPRIGKLFGNAHHTTVMTAIKRHNGPKRRRGTLCNRELTDRIAAMQAQIEELRELLKLS